MVTFLTFSACLLSLSIGAPPSKHKQYGVILDAGSSSTKIRAYAWPVNGHNVPVLETVDLKEGSLSKLKPGISGFVNRVFKIQQYIATLIDVLKGSIPEEAWSSTPVYFMATAGLRLLDENVTHSIMQAVEGAMSSPSFNPFLYEDGFARILSGEEEALFAWLTVNYLNGFFFEDWDHSENYGLVELGGGSLQIAFMPEDPTCIYAGKMSAQMAGREYAVYGHSHLSYGATLMSKRVGEYLVRENPNAYVIVNPCMLKGDTANATFYGKELVMVGGSNASLCEGILQHYLQPAEEDMCSPKPCSIGQVYQPSVRNRPFFTFGTIYFIAKDLGVLQGPGSLDLSLLASTARSYCSKSFSEAISEGMSAKWASRNCQDGLYIPLFFSSFGFHDNEPSLYASNDIGGAGIAWSIGAILYEEEREKYELFGDNLVNEKNVGV